MRVIAGIARSMPLKAAEGDNTRPTTDRIKETLFNMLQSDIAGCRFLDLYSGSGATVSYTHLGSLFIFQQEMVE